ncbi:MAG TPA: hypothetical protein VGV67_01370 [Solirubrobacteraceae bacterium]|nr:hypothetical protein [Solirubrobacteraceae bacterium]
MTFFGFLGAATLSLLFLTIGAATDDWWVTAGLFAGLLGVRWLMTSNARREAARRRDLLRQVGDPRELHGQWRSELERSIAGFDGFVSSVAELQPGPVRDRLAARGHELSLRLIECGALARHGQALDHHVRRLDTRGLRKQLSRAERDFRRSRDPLTRRTADELHERLRAAEELQRRVLDVQRQLVAASRRMCEVAARTAEFGLPVSDGTGAVSAELSLIDAEVAALGEALRTLELPASRVPEGVVDLR